MATSSKAKALIVLSMLTFGLAILGMYYGAVLDSDETEKGVSRMLNFGAAMTCMLALMFGFTIKMDDRGMQIVGVKGSGLVYAFIMMTIIGTIIYTTAKTWSSCKGGDDKCQKDQRTGFFVLSGLSILLLLIYFVTGAKKQIVQMARR